MIIRPMTPNDDVAVIDIYGRGLSGGNASFQQDPGTWESWDAGHLPECRLVACNDGGQVIGWAALSGVSSRCVYRGVAEVSVYIDPDFQGQGAGSKLLGALVEQSEKNGIWSLEAGIFPENTASIALHQKHGFVIIGHRRALGRMNYGPFAGTWRDVVLLQRRSTIVGID